MQRNTKSNHGSQHHNHKLSITQKSQLMSICLGFNIMIKYIVKDWLINTSVTGDTSRKSKPIKQWTPVVRQLQS
jgi:hypothetical protein